MIERAYIHVAGPTRSGKTTLVEAILRAFDGPAITVRCRCDDDLDESEESAPARDAGLRRYRASVASGAARFDFPAEEQDGDGLFCSKVLSDFSEAILIEGECPVGYVDLEVFMAPPLPAGKALPAADPPAQASGGRVGDRRAPSCSQMPPRDRRPRRRQSRRDARRETPRQGADVRALGAGAHAPGSGARRPRRRQGSALLPELGGPAKRTAALSKSKPEKIRTAPLTKSAGVPAPFPPHLGWTHYLVLLRVTNPTARAFYEIEAVRESWSSRELERQIASLLFERLAKSRDKEKVLALARRGHEVGVPADVLKDPFVLEFLGLDERSHWRERDLEQAIIDRIEGFLLELGKGFCFVARQKRVTLEGDHFYVDLVFYNLLLRCFVLVDLKLGKLTHQDLGQMQRYVNFFDRFQRAEHEARTIGIVLCSEKNDADGEDHPAREQRADPCRALPDVPAHGGGAARRAGPRARGCGARAAARGECERR